MAPCRRVLRILAVLPAFRLAIVAAPTTPAEIAREVLAPLLDQAKIATLKGDRPINTRTYKVHYWLEIGHRAGGDVPACWRQHRQRRATRTLQREGQTVPR